MHQLVIRRAQFRVPGVFAQPCTVDQRLRVLDAKTHRERLGFHEHATAVQHTESVTGAVAQRQDDVPGLDLFTAVELDAQQLAVLDHQVGHALLKAHFAAQRFDLVTHVFNHTGQAERADVRFADVENFFRRARFHELVQHLAADEFRVLDLAVKLAVGERTGTAFTELHVGLGVEHVLAPQRPRVLGALAHFGAALEDDRLEAHLRQQQPGKNAARPEAHHYRALAQAFRGVTDHFIADIRCRADVTVIGELAQQRCFILDLKVDGVDETQLGRLLARVVTAFEEGEVQQFAAIDAQVLQECNAQVFFRVIDRQLEFGDS
ncbi:hypothetical protein ALO94_200408 [Pseudomonas syringae pv. spinaceae]|uniref:Molybdenum cofactor biosynthesis protein B n=1 Tax=Pseudomonas syringae pv. spinaceae TaxID=264459 RepID=A0A0Q0GXZ9_PSESX|nr:hypothetical protein ALO94_200408 [Pseudomonas syringae pv. spinaceae]